MGYQIELPKWAAVPAILAVAAGAYLLQPTELRRNPAIEAMGLVGAANKYEVMYAQCTDGADRASLDAVGLVKGFAGAYSHRFPATSDEDAASFVVAARPQCVVASLYRLDRRLAGSTNGKRYRRTRIEV
jgi:hypothetical protein